MGNREAFEIIDMDGESSISFMVGKNRTIQVAIELWGVEASSLVKADSSGYQRIIRRMEMSEIDCDNLIKRLRKYLKESLEGK
jgi:hypothetical protein